jgi:hypothetical protein
LIDVPGGPKNRKVSQAMHGVPQHLKQQRLPSFGNNNVEDNFMSAGCINCRRDLLDNPYFSDITSSNLYVTPRVSPLPTNKKMGGPVSKIRIKAYGGPMTNYMKGKMTGPNIF